MKPRFFPFVCAACVACILFAWPSPGFPETNVDLISGSGLTGNFFQPSGSLEGNTLHLAFTGTVDGGTTFQVYYVPADSSKNFTDANLTGSDVRLNDVKVITGSPDSYTQGRRPSVFPISDSGISKVGVVFIGDNKIYFSILNPNLAAGSGTTVESVTHIATSSPSSNVTAISAAADGNGTVHVLYADDAGSGDIINYVSFPFNNASTLTEVGPLDTSKSATAPPQLSLGTDSSFNAHALWSSDGNSDGNSSTEEWKCFYSMIDPDGSVTTLPIPKTRIFGTEGFYLYPSISVNGTGEIFASSQSFNGSIFNGGELYLALINPELAPRDGTPLTDTDTIFTALPKNVGDIFLKPTMVSDSQKRVHIAGNGYLESGLSFAAYQEVENSFTLLDGQRPVSLTDIPTFKSGEFDGERSVITYISAGVAIFAWAGTDNSLSGASHLFMVTAPATAFPPEPQDESGCAISTSGDRYRANWEDGLFLLFPALLFFFSFLRRKVVNHRGAE